MIEPSEAKATQEQEKKYEPMVQSASDFVESEVFAKLNNYTEHEEYLDWIKEHQDEFEQHSVLIDNVAWQKEIIDGTTERGQVIRDFYILHDTVKRCGEYTQSVYNRLSDDQLNILDSYDMNPDEYKTIIEKIKLEYVKYQESVANLSQYIEGVGGKDTIIAFMDAKLLLEDYSTEEQNNFHALKTFLETENRDELELDIEDIENLLKFLKELEVSEESLKSMQEKIVRNKQQKEDRVAKEQRKNKMQYLTEKGNNRRRKNMMVAANSMSDTSVRENLASLGKLDDVQLNELVTLTKKVERLQKQLDYGWGVSDFVRNNIQRVRQKYDADLKLIDFPQTIQDLEVFVRVVKAVEKVADDYGIHDTIEMERQFDDEIWESDIFPTADEITL